MDSREQIILDETRDLNSYEPSLRQPLIRMPSLRPNSDIELHDMMGMMIRQNEEPSSVSSSSFQPTIMTSTEVMNNETKNNNEFSSLEVGSDFYNTIDNEKKKRKTDFCVVCCRPSMFRCEGCRDVKGSYCGSQCQSIDWPNHQRTCWRRKIPEEDDSPSLLDPYHSQLSNLNEEMETEKLFIEELKFYTHQVWLILFPVTACITIVIWGVKTVAITGFLRSGYVSIYEVPTDASSGQMFAGALINALIMMAAVVVATLLVVILFLCRCFKVSERTHIINNWD